MESTTALSSLGSCLVIGGCGFLGHHIVRQLLLEPTCTSVSVMCRNPTKNLFDKVHYYCGDITNLADVQRIFGLVKPRTIFNTASPKAYLDHELAKMNFTVNVDGNKNLLATAKASGTARAYVYTSSGPIIAGSCGIYNQATEDYPTLAILKKGDPYHLAKAMGDELVLSENNPNGLRTATIRPTAMYGEGDVQMIGNAMNVLENGQTNVCMGYNNVEMDVVYVGHVAGAEILAAKKLLEGSRSPYKVDGEAFNITDDHPHPPWTFFRMIWKLAGDETPYEKLWMIPPWLVIMFCEIAEWYCYALSLGRKRPKLLIRERMEFVLYTRTYSIEKARQRLDYVPWVSQQEALGKSLEWYLKEHQEKEKLQ